MKKIKIERLILLSCLVICLIALVVSGLEVEGLETKIKLLEHKNNRQAAQLRDRDYEIEIQQILIEMQDSIIDAHIAEPEIVPEYIGEYEITYYCPCVECCGKTDGITASGTLATEGQTIAADWDMLPVGTEIYIDGIGYRTVEDKGGAIKGKTLDIFVNSHTEALEFGRHKADVWIVKEGQNEN